MNEVRLTGKVLNAYQKDNSCLIAKIACTHEHILGTEKIRCESIFSVVMTDSTKINLVEFSVGDTVLVTGYLKIDFRLSNTGQERKKLTIYATNIEITKTKTGSFYY